MPKQPDLEDLLNRGAIRTIDLEIQRLHTQHGIDLSRKRFLELLIEHHRLTLRLAAECGEPQVLAWVWRRQHDEEE